MRKDIEFVVSVARRNPTVRRFALWAAVWLVAVLAQYALWATLPLSFWQRIIGIVSTMALVSASGRLGDIWVKVYA